MNSKKITLGIILLAVLGLVAVNIWQPAQFGFKDKTDYEKLQEQAAQENEQYVKLLASVQPNYAASQQLLEKIATEDVIKKEVSDTLKVGQTIVLPKINDSDIKLTSRTDNTAVVDYMNDVTSVLKNYHEQVVVSAANLFSPRGDAVALAAGKQETDKLVQNLKAIQVPKDAGELHKNTLAIYVAYQNIYGNATSYANSTAEPWDKLYHDYQVVDKSIPKVKSELNKLDQKYAFSGSSNYQLIKTARAQFGGFSVITADLERAVIEGVKAGLAKSFANFAIQMLDKVISHIEKNFAIASQLYYSKELGRYYSVEYMKKFVTDPLDQDIIQKFLPEYFCVTPGAGELKQIFKAKARANVGTDIVIDPSDPQFLQKLAKLGSDEKNYPQWWEQYYESLASQTKSEAESSATKEVLSPGLKSGRDIISGQINKTMASIFNTQEAAISGTINLGTNNAENIVGQITASIVESLVNKFIFTPLGGTSGTSAGIGILKEQGVCLKTPEIKPITPVPQTGYGEGSTPPFNPGS